MKNRTYYFINSDINPDTIYGSEMPCCITENEIARLAAEWECPDLMDQFHEATEDEIAEYGVYDD